uniref:Pentatricopeptide repeat-containing protein n=1 Tax=Solanum lycopersicum TaxID=4081 RepID=A0A3Q7FIY6_SOLLC
MTQLSLRLGNVLLSMFVRLGNLGDAWPDVYTFPCVLRTYGGLPDWRMGREIHAYVMRFIYDSEIDVVNALITMYVKCGDVCSARVLFNIMSKRDRILGMLAVQECCYDFGYESRLNFNSGLIHLLASV